MRQSCHCFFLVDENNSIRAGLESIWQAAVAAAAVLSARLAIVMQYERKPHNSTQMGSILALAAPARGYAVFGFSRLLCPPYSPCPYTTEPPLRVRDT